MRWVLSDGTEVTSDGKAIAVRGSSDFAGYLARRSVEPELLVPVRPPPDGGEPLDPSNAYNIDSWLEYEVAGSLVLVSERPDITAPEPEPDDDEVDDDIPEGMQRVY